MAAVGHDNNNRGFLLSPRSVIDSAMRYLWLIPLRNKTAETVANALYEDVIARTSVPSAVLTDLGKEFTAEILDRLHA